MVFFAESKKSNAVMLLCSSGNTIQEFKELNLFVTSTFPSFAIIPNFQTNYQ